MPYFSSNPLSPAEKIAIITPDDDNDLTFDTREIRVGTGGALKVDTIDGSTVTIPAEIATDGAILPIAVRKVYATGTTADNILGLF